VYLIVFFRFSKELQYLLSILLFDTGCPPSLTLCLTLSKFIIGDSIASFTQLNIWPSQSTRHLQEMGFS